LKILYAIQGTGNGHISRAREIVPLLAQMAELDVLISGQHAEIHLSQDVRFSLKGMGFIFGKSGGVDLLRTFAKNNTRRLLKEIRQLPIEEYDLVLSDFEPVSCWAARLRSVPCIGLSHQAAVLAPSAPRPVESDIMGRSLLQFYAPAPVNFGFHFSRYEPWIFPPVIRSEVRALAGSPNLGHFTVYLPAYDDVRIIKVLSAIPGVNWHVFSKHSRQTYREGSIQISPIENTAFLQSMATAEAVLCGAGFETPAEALFLGKRILVIPMKNQYEQQCNAAALASMGIPVLKNLKRKRAEAIQSWAESTTPPPIVDYPDITRDILAHIVLGKDTPLLMPQ
jgi:uncharacterized protein (TIGR00661 family)